MTPKAQGIVRSHRVSEAFAEIYDVNWPKNIGDEYALVLPGMGSIRLYPSWVTCALRGLLETRRMTPIYLIDINRKCQWSNDFFLWSKVDFDI